VVALRENAKLAIVDASQKALNAQAHVLAMGTAVQTQTMVNDFIVLSVRLILLLIKKSYSLLHLFSSILSPSDYSSNLEEDCKPYQPMHTGGGDELGPVFGPNCDDPCFLNKEECNHTWCKVELNNVGEYAVFPSSWWHQSWVLQSAIV
jgi:hypothetical protein